MSESENAFWHCDTCGAKVPARAPLGLCPKCMLENATTFGRDLEDAAVEAATIDADHVTGYSLVRPIGEGAFGIVYEAEQRVPVKRRVALKVLKAGMDSRQIMARFEAERQALALLAHPYISNVYDAGKTDSGRPYFAMEFVDGLPLTEFCATYRLTLKQRLELFGRVCQGVQHAHQKGIIHRDLKPGNILVERVQSEAGSHPSTASLHPLPRIIDFGIARATEQLLTEATLLTNAAQVLGTPGYMSPEQAAMNSEAVDTRSDVYALGAILYQLLTNALPFMHGETKDTAFDEILRRIREEDPPKPSVRVRSTPTPQNERIPPDLDWITLKALRKDPAERYSSVAELAADVMRFLNDEPVVARPPRASYIARKFLKRHKTAAAAVLVGGLTLLAGTIVSTILFLRAEDNAQRAQRSEQSEKATFSRSDFLGSEQLLRNDQAAEAVVQLVRAIRTDPTNQAAKFKLLSTLAYTDFILPTNPPIEDDLDPFTIAVSPDDKMVAVGGETGTARVRRINDGTLLRSLQHRAWVTAVAFHPADPNLVLTSSHDQTAILWNISTGKPERIFQHSGPVGWAGFTPDGQRTVTHAGDGTTCVWATQSGQKLATLKHGGDASSLLARIAPDGRFVAVSTGKSLLIWSLESLERVGRRLDQGDWIYAIDIHPRGLVASGGINGRAQVWDIRSGAPVTDPLVHPGRVHDVTFSPDGSRLLTATLQPDSAARVWDISLQQAVLLPMRHGERIHNAFFSSDGMRVITAGFTDAPSDAAIQVWDASTGSPASAPIYLSRGVRIAALTNDGSRLLTTSRDGYLRTWDIRSRAAQPHFLFHPDRIWFSTFTPDSQRVGTYTRGGLAYVWDAASGDPIRSEAPGSTVAAGWKGKNLAVSHVSLGRSDVRVWERLPAEFRSGGMSAFAFFPDGATLVTGAEDGTLRFWDFAKRVPIGESVTLDGLVGAVAVAGDGSMVVAATGKGLESKRAGSVHWFAADGTPLGSVAGVGSSVWELAISDGDHGNRTIAAGFFDGTVRIISTDDGAERVARIHTERIHSLAFSPNGRWLASGSADNTAIIWDIEKGAAHHHLTGHIDRATYGLFVAFSPDGEYLVTTASHDDTTRVWNVATGQQVSPPIRSDNTVQDINISPRAGFIAVGHPGRVLDPLTGESLMHELALDSHLSSISFSPDERRLVAGCWSGTAKVWDLPPYDINLPEWFLRFAEAYAGRRYGDDGLPQTIHYDELKRARETVFAQSGNDDLAKWAKWLAADPNTEKPVSPWATLTREAYANKLVQHGSGSALARALRVSPEHPLAMAKLAERIASRELTETRRIQADFHSRDAIETAPDNAEIWGIRARTLQKLERHVAATDALAAAETICVAAIENDSDNPQKWLEYAEVLASEGSRFAALEMVLEAEELAENGTELSSLIQSARKQWLEALPAGERLLVSTPADAGGRLGKVLLDFRRRCLEGEAEKALQESRAQFANEAGLNHVCEWVGKAHESVAHSERQAGDFGRALQHLRAAVLCYAAGHSPSLGLHAAHSLAELELEVGVRARAVEIVAKGATWRYHEGLVPIEKEWDRPGFDDTDWKSGPAPLGYGDTPSATTLDYGDDKQSKPITSYYRHAVEIADPTVVRTALAEFQFDDGIVIHVNGVEAVRQNMPAGQLSADTPARTTADKLRWHKRVIDGRLLTAGSNIIAVEIHQANATSSDIRLDFRLSIGEPDLLTEAGGLNFDEIESFLDWPIDLFARARAVIHYRCGEIDRARDVVDAALARTPESPVLLNLLGVLQRARNGGTIDERVEAYHHRAVDRSASLSSRARRLFQYNHSRLQD